MFSKWRTIYSTDSKQYLNPRSQYQSVFVKVLYEYYLYVCSINCPHLPLWRAGFVYVGSLGPKHTWPASITKIWRQKMQSKLISKIERPEPRLRMTRNSNGSFAITLEAFPGTNQYWVMSVEFLSQWNNDSLWRSSNSHLTCIELVSQPLLNQNPGRYQL